MEQDVIDELLNSYTSQPLPTHPSTLDCQALMTTYLRFAGHAHAQLVQQSIMLIELAEAYLDLRREHSD